MSQYKPKILYISSASPTSGPGRMVVDNYNIYKNAGFDVDVLTLYKVDEYPNFLYIYQKGRKPFINRLIDYLRVNIFNKPPFFNISPEQTFYYRYEEFPFVSNKRLLSAITKKYDMVFILFIQGMLTMSSIGAIYDKLQCPIHISGVDYWHMSGGCHFIGNCEGYQTGCKRCESVTPLWCNNFAHHNVKFREKVFKKVNPIIWGNSYLQGFYGKSYLLKNLRYEFSGATIDLEKQFVLRSFESTRAELAIPQSKSFVISFGCQSLDDPRKGIKYLCEVLRIFSESLKEEERKKIAIVTSGKVSDELKSLIPMEAYHLGFVSFDKLALMYSASDVFLCSSVNDAGPMMVNQALCCGTPVCAFEMGAALDSIKDKGTGYCAPLIDVQAFADNIMKIYKQTPEEKLVMRENARKFAEENFSKEAKIKNMWRVYEKYKNECRS